MTAPIPALPAPVSTRLRLLALVLALLVLAPAGLRAGDGQLAAAHTAQPVLRERIQVHGNLVTLGDLFENAGPAARVPVFRSPDLGTQGVVAAKRIAEAAGEHGLVWDNPGGIGHVTVERPSRLVGLEEIRAAIARAAKDEMDVTSAADLTVTLERRARPFHVSARITTPPIVKRLFLQGRNARFEAVIGFEDDAAGARERSYRGLVQETIAVAVPARPVERGETIARDGVKTIRLPRAELRTGMVTDAADLAGMAAKRNLPAEQPVRRTDLERPKMVRRNALVTVVYRTPGLSLKSEGRALGDAAEGETVAVLNPRSKRTVHGIVRGPGLVAVETLISRRHDEDARTRPRPVAAGPQTVN